MKQNLTKHIFAALCLLLAPAAWAQTFTVDNLSYTVTGEKAVSVSKTDGLTGDVVIPASVTYDKVTYAVTAIPGYAFGNTAITSVTIPASVVSVGERAFQLCNSLSSITIEDGATPLQWLGGTYYSPLFNMSNTSSYTLYLGRNLSTDGDGCYFPYATSVIIGDKVTTINDYLFQNAAKLGSVTIGNGVTSIGGYAFQGTGTDESVTNQTISMGSSVTTIGNSAFQGCSKLTEIALPDVLTVIPEYAFGNTGLTSITIPASVASVGARAFQLCNSLSSIVIEDSETPLQWLGGTYYTPLFNMSNTSSYTLYLGRTLSTDGDGCYFPYATSVTIGDKVTTINDKLFQGATKLASVTIGSGVTSIGASAFENTGTDESVTNQTISMGSSVTTIGTYAFQGCSKLTEIALPDVLTVIPEHAFGNTGLTSITIPASVASVGSCAFQLCNSLTSITIADSETPLQWLGTWYTPLYNMASTSSYTLYLGRNLSTDGDGCYFPYATSVTIGDKVTTINDYLFQNAAKLGSVTIGNGVTSIGAYAFQGTGTDESVTNQTISMGSSVTTIGTYAFQGCSKLTEITLSDALTVIPEKMLNGTAITSITIPASVASVGSCAFEQCNSLTSIVIEDSETPLQWLGGTYYTPLYNMANTSSYTLYLGRNLSTDGDGCYFPYATSVTIGNKVTAINSKLFQSATKLASVTLGSGVTSMGTYAFDGCTTLASIDLSAATGLTEIPERVFNECDALTAITIPASVQTIESSAFYNMDADINVTIEDGETPLTLNCAGSYYPIFESNNTVTAYVGRNIIRTGYYANRPTFDGSLVGLTFGPKVTAIGDYEYQGCSNLAGAVNGLSNVVSIGAEAFNNCPNITSIEIGNKLATLGEYAFQDCQKLESISLPGTLKKIPTEAFENCFALATVTLGEGIEEIGNGAFYDTDALTEITIPASVKKIGRAPFYCNSNQAMTRMIIADSDTPLEFANGTSEYNYGYDHITDNIALDYFYLGRDITRAKTDQSLVYSATNIEIGPKVTNIDKLFDHTSDVQSVKVHALTPIAISTDPFESSTYANATLWVPGGTKAAYQAADYWKNFTNIETWSFVLNYTVNGHGTMDIDGEAAGNGETKTVRKPNGDGLANSNWTWTVTPDAGYELTSLTVEDKTEATDPAVQEIFVGNAGWENPHTEGTAINHDLDYVATFAPITYAITYDLAGGTVATANPATYNVESAAFTLTNPTREGYTFAGWTGTDLTAATTTVTIAKGSIGDRSYTATWTPITYNVTYDLAGGAVATPNPATYNIESAAFTLTNPTRTGYTFAGWTGTDLGSATATVTVAKGSMGNRSYTATWTPVTYTITYDLAGGTVSTANPTSYNIETAAFTLNNPTREHYLFAGWTGTDLTSATEVVTVAKGSTGNRSFTATWTAATYAVTISGAGVTASNNSPKYGESVTITITDDPDRTLSALTINGTDVTSSVSGGKYTIASVSGDVSVVATFASTKEFISVSSLGIKTYCCAQDLDFTGSDLRAYIAAGYNKATNTVLLVRVYDVPAGTGIIVKGDEGTYKIPYATTQAYYVNMLVGVVGAGTVYKTTGTMSNYVLNNGGDGIGFYTPVDAGASLNNGAYLQVPTALTAGSSKVRYMFEDEGTATDIAGFEMYDQRSNEGIYNMSGQKLDGVQRGLNIVNGKKVLVK